MTSSSAHLVIVAHAATFPEEVDRMLMPKTEHVWTLDELHRLPDDGNRYELVRGELFVTPAPSFAHEALASELARLLDPYVDAQHLGRVYRPRAVFQALGSETEPDLIVSPVPRTLPKSWADAPRPLLVVEILSESTRRRDLQEKRDFYVDTGIPDYWVVDGDSRTIRVIGPNRADVLTGDALVWHPADAAEPLTIAVREYFRAALG